MTTEEQTAQEPAAEEQATSPSQSQPSGHDVPEPHPRGPDGKFRPKGLPEDEAWDYVELSPEAQKRFNRVYGALKHHQALGEQLLNDNVILADRLEKLEKRVVSSEGASTEAQLKGAKAAALAAQDYARVVEIDDALMELKTKSLQQQVPEGVNAPIETAAANYQLDEASKRVLDDWGSERGSDGEPLRPWVDPRHPLHEKANRAHQLVMADPMTAFADISTVLDAIDKYMGVDGRKPAIAGPSAAAKPAKHATWTGLPEPPKSKSAQPQLTAQQIHIAKKMYRGDPNAIERYRKAIMTHARG